MRHPSVVAWRGSGTVAILLAVPFVFPGVAAAQSCTPVALTDGTVVTLPFQNRVFTSFASPTGWAVVGLQGLGPGDWDLYGYDHANVQAPPDCYGVPLLRSVYQPPTGDVIGWNFAAGTLPPGPYVAEARLYEAFSGPKIELDSSPRPIAVDASPVTLAATPSNLVELWETDLEAGRAYTVTVDGPAFPSLDGPAVHVLAPQPVINTTLARSIDPGSFTAAVDGRHAIVGSNPIGVGQAYSVSLSTCSPPGYIPNSGARSQETAAASISVLRTRAGA